MQATLPAVATVPLRSRVARTAEVPTVFDNAGYSIMARGSSVTEALPEAVMGRQRACNGSVQRYSIRHGKKRFN
jgi:hypothetical protein